MADPTQYGRGGPQMPGNPLVGKADVSPMPGNPLVQTLIRHHVQPSAESQQRIADAAQVVAQRTGVERQPDVSTRVRFHPVSMPGNPGHRRTPSSGSMPQHIGPPGGSHAASGHGARGLGDPIPKGVLCQGATVHSHKLAPGFTGHGTQRPPFLGQPVRHEAHPGSPRDGKVDQSLSAHHGGERPASGSHQDDTQDRSGPPMTGNPGLSMGQKIGSAKAMHESQTGDQLI